jgi:hypothetical protein
VFDARPHTGPVVVSNVYTVSAKNEQAFIKAMARVRLSRLRTGASRWGLFRDGEPPISSWSCSWWPPGKSISGSTPTG